VFSANAEAGFFFSSPLRALPRKTQKHDEAADVAQVCRYLPAYVNGTRNYGAFVITYSRWSLIRDRIEFLRGRRTLRLRERKLPNSGGLDDRRESRSRLRGIFLSLSIARARINLLIPRALSH